jgi:FkbM family methyltransferase
MTKKKHYDYVDIGTSYFDTSADIMKEGERVLLIEPIKEYLDRIPNKKGVEKYCVAISDYRGTGLMYYVDEEVAKKYNAHFWVLGCNSLDAPHPSINSIMIQNNLSTDLVKERKSKVIKFADLIKRYNIGSIGHLKIDTEGHDHVILKEVLDLVHRGLRIDKITVEYMYYFGNTELLDILFKTSGYRYATMVDNNVMLHEYKETNNRSSGTGSRKKRGSKTLPGNRKRSR